MPMDEGTPVVYRWQVHLAKAQPERLPVVVLALVGAPLLGAWLMGHWIFGLAALWMLWSATADYLLPIRYEADAAACGNAAGRPRDALGARPARRVGRDACYSARLRTRRA